MLALPIIAGLSGFIPSTVAMLLVWGLMIVSALFLLEAMVTNKGSYDLLLLVEQTLGKWGKKVVNTSFLFLFFSLIICYLAKGGEFLNSTFQSLKFPVVNMWGPLFLAVSSACVISLGTKFVDHLNKIMMFVLFLAYFSLMYQGDSELYHTEYLFYQNWRMLYLAVPFLITSFGFHNMIPTLREYTNDNVGQMVKMIVFGGLIPFVFYFLWVMKSLLIVPLHGDTSIFQSYLNGDIITSSLARISSSRTLSILASYFAFFAISTSLLTQSLSVLKFFKMSRYSSKVNLSDFWISLLVFMPCLALSQTIPNVFYSLLEVVGGILAVILFGIIPSLMVWKLRYVCRETTTRIVPGGKVVVLLVFVLFLAVLVFETLKTIGLGVLDLPI